MRTASNSVLSVSPETLSKSTKAPISTKGEGRLFSDDFSKAQAALGSKQSSPSKQSSASPSPNATKSSPAVGAEQKVLGSHQIDVKANSSEHDLPSALPVTGKGQSIQTAEGGKKLQSAGVESPVSQLAGTQASNTLALPRSEETLLSSDNQEITFDTANVVTEGALTPSTPSLTDESTQNTQSALQTSAATANQQVHTDALATQSELNASVVLPAANGANLADRAAIDGAADEVIPTGLVKPMSNMEGSPSKPVSVAQGGALLSTTGVSQGVASAALAVGDEAPLPAKTEVAKGVQIAQSSASRDQLLSPDSGILGTRSAEAAPVQGDRNAGQGAAGAVSGGSLVAPQTPLDVSNGSIEQAMSDGAKTPQGLLDKLDKTSSDASTVTQQASKNSLASEVITEASSTVPSVTTSAMSSSGAGAMAVAEEGVAGVLGLAALASTDGEKVVKTRSGELDKKSVPQPDDLALSNEAEIAQDGELSWVLSQMQPSADSKASLGLSGAAMTAAAAPIIAGDKRQQVSQTTGLAGLSDTAKGLNVGQQMLPLALKGEQVTSGSDKDLKFTDMMGDNGVLLNEPVELRKKEQDAMIGKMMAQFDGAGSKGDVDTGGGMNSSINNHHNVNRPALGAGAATLATGNNGQANLTMNLPPNHPGWASEMSQKVAWVVRDGGHTAHIRLDPPELGSLTVKVSVDQDSNTQVSFVAATPQARDLLEGQMSRLRDMLAQQGMDLSHVDVDVSQQDASGAQYRQSAQDDNTGTNRMGVLAKEELEDDLPLSNVSYTSATGIDYYA